MSALSRRIFHPLWDIKDNSVRLSTLRALQRSQWGTEEALRIRQQQRLTAALRYAYEHVPYYRQSFSAAGLDGNRLDAGALPDVPLLSKSDIRASADKLLAEPWRDRQNELSEHKTGGSTGVSLRILFDRQWEQIREADALRANQWAGWHHGMKVAAIWGNPPVPRNIKEWLYSKLYERLIYLDTMDINDASVLRFVDLWRREQPEIVFGHSHSIYIFAQYLERAGVDDLRPRGIVATSMMLLKHERETIERVFGCRVTDRYGCEEVGLIAAECEYHDGMHLNIEHLQIEFLRSDGTAVKPGEEGEIVVTDLLNKAMPLIRYRVEDAGVPSDRACPCGRGLPMMERVVGRVADYLKRADGSLVAGVSLVERTLTNIAGIEQMQIVQNSMDQVDVNIVEDAAFNESSKQRLVEELKSVLGANVHVDVISLARIPQERSGKYRFSICRA